MTTNSKAEKLIEAAKKMAGNRAELSWIKNALLELGNNDTVLEDMHDLWYNIEPAEVQLWDGWAAAARHYVDVGKEKISDDVYKTCELFDRRKKLVAEYGNLKRTVCRIGRELLREDL